MNALEISDKIFEQFDEIRELGECDMMDGNSVMVKANELKFHEIINFCYNDRGKIDSKKYYAILSQFEDWAKGRWDKLPDIVKEAG